MNENKRIDNPRLTIVKCVGADSYDEKMRWIIITKATMVVIFNLQDSHFLTLSLPTKVFQVHGWNRPVANLPVVDFHSQPREMLTPKTLNAQLSVYFLKESLNLIVCQRYVFFSVLAAIIRKSSGKQLALRSVKALPFIHQPERVAPKASDVSAADWLYQHTWINTIFFHVCCYGFSPGWKSLYNTAVYMIKKFLEKHYADARANIEKKKTILEPPQFDVKIMSFLFLSYCQGNLQ